MAASAARPAAVDGVVAVAVAGWTPAAQWKGPVAAHTSARCEMWRPARRKLMPAACLRSLVAVATASAGQSIVGRQAKCHSTALPCWG